MPQSWCLLVTEMVTRLAFAVPATPPGVCQVTLFLSLVFSTLFFFKFSAMDSLKMAFLVVALVLVVGSHIGKLFCAKSGLIYVF